MERWTMDSPVELARYQYNSAFHEVQMFGTIRHHMIDYTKKTNPQSKLVDWVGVRDRNTEIMLLNAPRGIATAVQE